MDPTLRSLTSACVPAILLAVCLASAAQGQERDLKQEAAEHRAKVQQSIADAKERMAAKKEEMRLKREERDQARQEAAEQAEIRARAAEQQAAEHRAKVEESMAATRASIQQKQEEMQLESEAWESRAGWDWGDDGSVEQEASELRNRVHQSIEDTSERIRVQTEAAELAREQGAQDGKQQRKFNALLWAKRGGLIVPLLAGVVGHLVASRRRRNGTLPTSG